MLTGKMSKLSTQTKVLGFGLKGQVVLNPYTLLDFSTITYTLTTINGKHTKIFAYIKKRFNNVYKLHSM